jgi:hypothetical protein
MNPTPTERDPSNLMDNAQHHIRELRDWLAAHPSLTTAQGRVARADRERSLAYWLKVLAREDVASQGGAR